MVQRFTFLIDWVVIGVVVCLILWFGANIILWIKQDWQGVKEAQMNRLIASIVGIVVIVFVGLIVLWNFMAIVKVEGNEVYVVQDWQGVKDAVMQPGTHIYNNFVNDVYKYDMGVQKITFDSFNNKDSEWESIPVEVGENGGQKAKVSISCNYRLNPTKVVSIHKQGLRLTYESVILKREIVDTVNEIARPHTSALDLYSGTGFVKFKNDVDKALRENTFLVEKGIDIENTIIYQVHLDPNYEAEIAAKQIAQQQALRKQEETKAAQEEAKRIFAMSQAEVEKVRQEAEAKKITMVTAAEAGARKTVLDAEAERDSNLARGSGELAVGKARAEVAMLNRDAQYAGESGARKAEVEIQTKRAEIMKGLLEGVVMLPERAFVQVGKTSGVIAESQNQ